MTRRITQHQERGAVLLVLVIAMLLVVTTTLVVNQVSAIKSAANRTTVTQQRLEEIRRSLVAFVSTNGRLPCPANGAIASGVPAQGTANPAAPTAVCTTPNGTVPWAALGLSAEQTLDGWGRRISYRVAQGANGMTIAGGADMTQCQQPALGTELPPMAPAFLCTVAHTESEAGFLGARAGLTVNDMGTNVAGIGFVLISYGSTGYGAWLESGAQLLPLPGAGNIQEFANAGGGTTYFRAQHTDSSVPPTANNHFDDEVIFLSIADLIHEARRGGRPWGAGGGGTPIVGQPPVVNLNAATLATGGANFTGFQSNLQTVTLPSGPTVSVSLTISTAPSYQITINNAGGRIAIGVCSMTGGCNSNNSQLEAGEYLSFKLNGLTAQKVSFDFLGYSAGESATITFKKNGTAVGVPIVVTYPESIGLMPTTAPAAFDEVIVQPNGSSDFYIQGIRFCDAASAC